MFWKYGVVIMLNTFLGPGVGQLLLKQFKKGFAIIGTALVLLIVMSFILISSADTSAVPQDFEAMKSFARELILQNSDKLKIINYALMALWIYSYMDIINSAIIERKKNAEEKKENE